MFASSSLLKKKYFFFTVAIMPKKCLLVFLGFIILFAAIPFLSKKENEDYISLLSFTSYAEPSSFLFIQR